MKAVWSVKYEVWNMEYGYTSTLYTVSLAMLHAYYVLLYLTCPTSNLQIFVMCQWLSNTFIITLPILYSAVVYVYRIDEVCTI